MRIIGVAFVIVLAPCMTHAGDGGLDPAFGTGGVVEIGWAAGFAKADSVGLDSAGRILVGGGAIGIQGNSDFALFRLMPGGTLDTSYAMEGGGFRLVDFDLDGIGGQSPDEINDLSVQSDGSVVALGGAHFGFGGLFSQFALMRLNPAGELDPGFGDGGTAHFGFNTLENWDQPTTLAIDASGRILATGWVLERVDGSNTLEPRLGLARLTSDAHFDASFINGGLLETVFWRDSTTTPPTLSHGNVPYAVAVDWDGRILLSGNVYDPIPDDAAVARFTTDGSFDIGFNATGRLLLALSNGVASALYPAGDGKVLVAGGMSLDGQYDLYLTRRNADGTPDTTFGTNGIATLPAADLFPAPTLIAPTHAGGWLVAGALYNSGGVTQAVVLARFDASGQPDLLFGNGGIAIVDVADGRHFSAGRVVLQPDGKLVVAGSLPNPGPDMTPHFAVMRILADYETVFADGFDGR